MNIEYRQARQMRAGQLRDCAYCRVSTKHEDQVDSLDNQIANDREVIAGNPDYEFAGIYYDSGISGYRENRPGFQNMLKDAREGKFDLILTKSISRFARNTVVVLEATRELKSLKIGVFFELQNIYTLSNGGELLLTIMAAFAQGESEDNRTTQQYSYRRRYEASQPVYHLEKCFGYEKNEQGELMLNAEEAPWVRRVFEMVLEGYRVSAVKDHLNSFPFLVFMPKLFR